MADKGTIHITTARIDEDGVTPPQMRVDGGDPIDLVSVELHGEIDVSGLDVPAFKLPREIRGEIKRDF